MLSGVIAGLSAYPRCSGASIRSFCGEIDAEQLVLLVGGEIELSKLGAGRDALIIAAVGHINLVQQLVRVVDVIDTDAGAIGHIQ